MTLVDGVDLSADAARAAAVMAVLAGALVLNAVIPVVLRFLIRRAVHRAMTGRGRWRRRLPRVHDGAGAEQRRVQRADAAAHMLSRVGSLAVLVTAALVVFRVLAVDPVVMLSSAGFVGAGLAFGGQAVIKDWITGLLVLLEDRYAVGDHVTVTLGGNEVSGTVETLGGVGLRLRLHDGSTWHSGHGSIESVVNRSQQLVAHSFEVASDVWSEMDETLVGRDLNAASHDLGMTDVLLVSDIAAHHDDSGTTRVVVQASRPLTEKQRQMVANRLLAGPAGPRSPNGG